MSLIPVLCETTCAIGPLRTFGGEEALVVKKKTGRRLLSDHHTGANCDERWHKSSTGALGGKNNVDTKT